MGTVDQHIKQWQHNRQLLPAIPADCPDWMVTIAFYTALHAIDAMLHTQGVVNFNSHSTRHEVLINVTQYELIAKRHLPFYNLSRTVRYAAEPMQWVPVDKVEKEVFGRYLYPIENSAFKIMGRPYTFERITLKKG